MLVNEKVGKLYLEARYHIALAFFFLNNIEGAIRAMKDVIRVDDRLVSAWFNMAIFYEMLGKNIESKIAYKRYFTLVSEIEDDF